MKKIEAADAPALKKMIATGEVYRFLPTFLFELQYDDTEQMIGELYGDLFQRKESLFLGIYLKNDLSFCGIAEFYGYKDSIHKTCVGYRLMKEYWGKKIATQAVGLMVEYLYTQTDIEIITASTMIENGASAHVLQKNDFIMTAQAVPEDWGYEQDVLADKWFR